jgi:glutamine amidotransferase/cyclase
LNDPANTVQALGFEYKWIESVEDFDKADVSPPSLLIFPRIRHPKKIQHMSQPFFLDRVADCYSSIVPQLTKRVKYQQRILFPGVGAFGSAMTSLRAKGFAEPLKAYIASGRPYFGICIGMQALCLSSDESDDVLGLGIIPAHVARFSKTSKAVPCIGYNGATSTYDLPAGATNAGIDEESSYYFVHSYCVKYDSSLEDWALTLTRYGDEVYVSSVQKGNVTATQFHPEKSGRAGLKVLETWLSQKKDTGVDTKRSEAQRLAAMAINGFTKRIVACLDVRANDAGDLVVTKGDQYDVREDATPSAATATTTSSTTTIAAAREVRNLGKPVDLAKRYFDEGADEIALLNITSFRSCPLHDQPMLDVVREAAKTVFVPLTIGGGIRDTIDPDGTARSALEVAGAYFRCGADKVSIGSDAVYAVEEMLNRGGSKSGSTGIEMISAAYGNQAVVVSIDPRRSYGRTLEDIPAIHRSTAVNLGAPLPNSTLSLADDFGPNGEQFCWYQCTVQGGRESRDLDVVQLAQGVEKLGAGEILLNSVDRDGSKAGFDIRLVNLVRSAISIPVIASSGAGKVEDFVDVFNRTGVEAALAAGIFHRKEVPIVDVKNFMALKDVGVRRA